MQRLISSRVFLICNVFAITLFSALATFVTHLAFDGLLARPLALKKCLEHNSSNLSLDEMRNNSTNGPEADETEDWRLSLAMVWTWSAVVSVLICWFFVTYLVKHIRAASTVGRSNQSYFATPNRTYGRFKRHLLDAPLFRRRHHREFRISSAMNVGTLPSRIQTIFLGAYFAMIITLTCYNINWSGGTEVALEQLMKRSGYIAVFNMIPLFVLAGRNNPLISLTGIPFDTYNLIHRWLGRIVVLEALVHSLIWLISTVKARGWDSIAKAERSPFILSGTIVSRTQLD